MAYSAPSTAEARPLLPADLAAELPPKRTRSVPGARRGFRVLLSAVVILSLFWVAASRTRFNPRHSQPPSFQHDPSVPHHHAGPAPSTRIGRHRKGRTYDAFSATGRHGAVATENEICSDMGVESTLPPSYLLISFLFPFLDLA